MIIRIDAQSPVPAFEQLRGQVEAMIGSAVLPVGHRLPTIRQLAKDLGLAPGTVARAYQELERSGAVVTRGRHGSYVADVAALPPLTGDFDEAVEALAVKGHQLGMNADQVAETLRRVFQSVAEST